MQLTMNTLEDPNELAWQLPANRWTDYKRARADNQI
jgi:hypothetical protein